MTIETQDKYQSIIYFRYKYVNPQEPLGDFYHTLRFNKNISNNMSFLRLGFFEASKIFYL